MSRYDDQILDNYGRPVPGASVYVYDDTGALETLTDDLAAPLANPLTSDSSGLFAFNAADGEKTLDVWFGGIRRWREAILVGPIPVGPVGPAGDVSKADTRAAMAAIVGQVAKATRYLAEAGREGAFVWTAGNLAAFVAADTAQGIYVPPASDVTGASGAWVRKFDGPAFASWFGVVANDIVNDGPAYLAALAALEARSVATGYGYGKGMEELRFPPTPSYLGANTLDIYTAMRLKGCGFGENGGIASLLRWDAGVTGIRVHSTNTLGAAGTRAPDGRTGAGTIIEGLALQGVFSGVESETHGIHLRARATIQECWIASFNGDGLYINATSLSGGATEGNANNCFVQRCTFAGCRTGVFIQGGDSNAGTFIMCDVLYNRRWGIWDNSFLGNAHFGHHASSNGLPAAPIAATLVSQGGNHYSVIVNQDAGAAVNAPSGTTADTAYWYYVRPGGVGPYTPAWVNGGSVRSGGPYMVSTSELTSCYSEADQAVAQIVGTGSTGGTPAQFSGAKGDGKIETKIAGFTVLNVGLRLLPNGAMSGFDGLELYSYNFRTWVQAYNRVTAAYSPVTISASQIVGDIAGATIHTTVAAGLNLAAGKALQVGGVNVVGAQGAAVADVAAITSAAGVAAGALTAANVGAPAAITTSNAANAVAAPTQAEFNAFVAKFNLAVADLTAFRTTIASLVTELNKEEADMATVRTALNTLVTTFNQDRTDVSNVRTTMNTTLARIRAATGHGLVA